MAEWLGQSSQEHEMNCHDLEAVSSNHSQIELGARSNSKLYFFFPVLPTFDVGDIFSFHIFTVYIQCAVSI